MSNDNVVQFPFGEPEQPQITVEEVLDAAKNLQMVLVIGWDESGKLRVSSSATDISEAVFMMELAKAGLLNMAKSQFL